MEILDKNGLSILWSKIKTKFGNYLPLTGGTMTGILYADSAIIAQGRGSNKGYHGYFNNSNYALIGNGTHIFNGSGKAQGGNALSFGQNSFAGIKNQDSDKDEYPYLALQPMNTQPIEVNTTTSSLGGGIFYGYPLLAGEVVEYSTPAGGKFTYENTSNRTQILLLVKNSDDGKLIFAGTPDHTNLRDICYILFSSGYPSSSGEVINQVTERTIGDKTYYEVILRAYQTSSFPARYDFKTQNQFNCITKVNDTILSAASTYRSGIQAMAFNHESYAIGGYCIALGMNSWATNFASLSMGYNSKALNYQSTAIGASSLASGTNSITLGNNSIASAYSSIAIGRGSLAYGMNSITLGVMSQARGGDSIAFGYESQASGSQSMAFGYGSQASGSQSMAFGYGSQAKNSNSTVFAYYGISSQDQQTVLGKHNAEETGALLIGGGTSDTNKKNIFKVDWDGNVTGKYFSGYTNSVGGEGFKIYPENSNEINFGGIGSGPEIIFGKSSKDNRSIPIVYKFGANGDASLIGSSFSGNSATATKLSTPRTLTIGNTGKTFDGSGDVSWTLDEIGAKDENVKYTTSVDNVDYRLTAIGQRIAGNVEGVNGVVTAEGITMNPSTGNLKATSFTGSLIGNADTATKLGTTTIGGSGKPIYLNGGTPTACNLMADDIISTVSGYEGEPLGDTLNMMQMSIDDKASTAVVTASTNGLMSSEMYNTKKVSSISVRQGAVQFEEPVRNHDIYVTYNEDNALNSDVHKVGGDVQLKIPNATTDYDGSMSYLDKRKLDSFKVDTSTNYYMGNVARINGDYMLPPDGSITDLKNHAPIYGTIADHLELQNGISSGKIPEMIRLSIHNITYMFSLNTIDYTNNQIVYVCPYVQVQFTINSSTSQFEINLFNPI